MMSESKIEVDLTNTTVPIHVVSESYDVLLKFITDYEIKHTVKFAVSSTGGKPFNKDAVPWLEQRDQRVRWISNVVPARYGPFFSVSKKQLDCMFGKQKQSLKKPEEKIRGNKMEVNSYKIGCISQILVEEIIRVLEPNYVDGKSQKYRRNQFHDKLRTVLDKVKKGEPAPFKWRREFHMIIGPLNEHKHEIGEAAGPHMKVDTRLIKRIQDLAESGIIASDVVIDNLKHYVENVLFKGQPPPPTSNRRFYPTTRDVRNHIGKVKRAKGVKEPEAIDVGDLTEHETATLQLTELESLDAGSHQFQQTYSNQQYCQDEINSQYHDYYTDSAYNHSVPIPQTDTEVCVQTTHASPSRSTAVRRPLKRPRDDDVTENKQLQTSTYRGRWNKRNEKTKFQALIRQLNKISNLVQRDEDFKKLSASLVNVIVQAKPMVPADKVTEVFKEEPRVLLHPRRIRTYRKLPPKTPTARAPTITKETVPAVPVTKMRKVTGKHWSEMYGTEDDKSDNKDKKLKTAEDQRVKPAIQTKATANTSLNQPTTSTTSTGLKQPTTSDVRHITLQTSNNVVLPKVLKVDTQTFSKLLNAKNIHLKLKTQEMSTQSHSQVSIIPKAGTQNQEPVVSSALQSVKIIKLGDTPTSSLLQKKPVNIAPAPPKQD